MGRTGEDHEGLSVTVIVQAIRRETGCLRATAYRAVSDAFAAGILSWSENAPSSEPARYRRGRYCL